MVMLDHVGFAVADYKRSKAFYEKALAPLGLTLLMEFSGAAAGFGRDDGGRPSFFIEAHGEPLRGRLHTRCGPRAERKWTRSTPQPSRQVELTTAHPVSAGTTPTITAVTS